MSKKVQEVSYTLNGKPTRFRVAQLPGMQGYLLSNDILQILAPGVKALSGLKPGTKLSDIPIADIAPVLGEMMPALTREKQEALTRELLGGVTVVVANQQVPVLDVFDDLFMGEVLTAYKLMVFTIKANFGNFGGALGSLGIERPTPAPSHFDTSDTSAGPPSA